MSSLGDLQVLVFKLIGIKVKPNAMPFFNPKAEKLSQLCFSHFHCISVVYSKHILSFELVVELLFC